MDNNIKKEGIKENNNYIIAEVYIDSQNINKDIKIINSYEEGMRNFPNEKLIEVRLNEKEIKKMWNWNKWQINSI